MAEFTLADARRVLQYISDDMVEKFSRYPTPQAVIMKQLLEERRQVAALREKYPYEVLDKMTDVELEKLLCSQLLNRFPAVAILPLLRDIFTIQDRRQGNCEPQE